LRALVLASLLLPAAAGANGRAAAVMSITHRAGSTQDLLLGTTFGTLVSRDGGATFHWFCERIAGYLSGDPVWRWLPDGAIVATVPEGLAVSRDLGCSFTRAEGTDGIRTADVKLDPVDPARVYVLTVEDGPSGRLLESVDGARSFPVTLLTSPVGRFLGDLEVAPSDPDHLYVKAIDLTSRAAWVMHSPDRGGRWDEQRFQNGSDFRLVAVDPAAPETVYVTTASPDALLRSVDGGRSFVPIYNPPGAIDAVAFFAGRLYVHDLRSGLSRSTDLEAPAFEPVPGAPRASCLTPVGDRLLACANYQLDRYVAGESTGDAFSPLMTWFGEIPGPIACPESSPAAMVCGPEWAVLGPQFQPQADAGVPDAQEMTPPPPPRSGGCSVSGGGASWLVVLLAVILRGERWRRRCPRGRRLP
jgi:hypothetical protein